MPCDDRATAYELSILAARNQAPVGVPDQPPSPLSNLEKKPLFRLPNAGILEALPIPLQTVAPLVLAGNGAPSRSVVAYGRRFHASFLC